MSAAADRFYLVERAATAKHPARCTRCATFPDVKTVARFRLMEPALVTEFLRLPLGCEVIRRVGVLQLTGRITWHRDNPLIPHRTVKGWSS